MNVGYESEAKYGRWQTAMLGGVVLLAVLLLINLSLLFFVYAEASSASTSEELIGVQKELKGILKSVTYYRAQYEQQKVQLYELNNRLTENEIEMKSRLITLEKAHAED